MWHVFVYGVHMCVVCMYVVYVWCMSMSVIYVHGVYVVYECVCGV